MSQPDKPIVLDLTEVHGPYSWSSDSRYFATGSIFYPRIINIYDVTTQEQVNSFDHTHGIYDMKWHPTQINQIAVGEDQGGIAILNPFTAFEYIDLTNIGGEPVFSPDGSYLAGHSLTTNEVRIYDTTSWNEVSTIPVENGITDFGLEWTSDAFIVISARDTVTKWDAVNAQQLVHYTLTENLAGRIYWKPDGSKFLTFGGYPEQAIYIANGDTGEVLAQSPPDESDTK